ncbi:TLC domain-containing protein [Infundibulicybe gibba]|nr:TLC domain-containing protein [Infundibulicybe gibba]
MNTPAPPLGALNATAPSGLGAATAHVLTHTLGLTRLPPHLPTLLASFAFFLAVHQGLAPAACWGRPPKPSRGASGDRGRENGKHSDTDSDEMRKRARAERRARNNWSVQGDPRGIALHALLIVPLALRHVAFSGPVPPAWERAFGWHDTQGGVHAIACGYFLWDTMDAVLNFTDVGFVLHGAMCLAIYSSHSCVPLLSSSFPADTLQKPFVAYYGTRCLLWEASTVFLNNHWFLDKTGHTGSTLQRVNGAILLVTFFGVRIVYGGWVSYDFLKTLLDPAVRAEVTLAYWTIFGLGNIVLQGLNWFWFTKMIAALRKRFRPALATANGNGVKMNGAYSNGHVKSA